jgi:predicted PurR-regulated permease PerM
MDTKRPIAITITPGTVAVALLIVGAFWLAFMLRDLLLVVLTAVVFASSIEPIAKWFVRFGFPKVLAVVIIYLVTLLMIVSFFYFFLPPLTNEAVDFFKTLPAYIETLNINSMQMTFSEGETESLATQLLQMQDILKTSSMSVLGAANTIFGGLMSFILIVVLSFYIAVQDKGLDDFLRLVTPLRHHGYLLDLWKRAQVKIGRWLQGQLLLSLLVGVMVYIGLLFLGVKYALLLAILAAVFELIPVFGSILAAIPAVVLAFIESGTTLALLVIVLYTVINQLQGNIIYPMVVQKVLGVPPLVIILAIIAGAQLAGFLGILIAVPVAAAVQEWVGDVQRGKQQLVYPSEDGSVL